MYQRFAIVKVNVFGGATDERGNPIEGAKDRQNKVTVFFTPVAGVIPNRNTMAGAVAERAGFEIGKMYLVKVRLRGFDEDFGAQFVWDNLGEVSALGMGGVRVIVEAAGEAWPLGSPDLEVFDKPANPTYERKTVQHRGQQTTNPKFHPLGTEFPKGANKFLSPVRRASSPVQIAAGDDGNGLKDLTPEQIATGNKITDDLGNAPAGNKAKGAATKTGS